MQCNAMLFYIIIARADWSNDRQWQIDQWEREKNVKKPNESSFGPTAEDIYLENAPSRMHEWRICHKTGCAGFISSHSRSGRTTSLPLMCLEKRCTLSIRVDQNRKKRRRHCLFVYLSFVLHWKSAKSVEKKPFSLEWKAKDAFPLCI